ncbi:MAG: MYG1 family protein [Candidatus Coprovivens sp.]
MKIKITKNKEEANLITHDGKFHPDDIFSTVLLSKIVEKPCLYRIGVGQVESEKAIIYDVGFGKFDHHGPNAKKRPNSNLKYCSFGLLWTEYGHKYLNKENYDYVEELYNAIEETLVKQIDGIDNGIFPEIKAEYKLLDLDEIIDMYNPTWEETPDTDINFANALNIAEEIFDNVIRTEYSKIKATKIVESKINSVKNNILILDKYMPYQHAIFSSTNPLAKEIKIIILPSNRGGYCIKPITVREESKELLINFPKEYRGLHDEELAKISGIKTAKFVHASGFLASTETLEDAILLAHKALENKE